MAKNIYSKTVKTPLNPFAKDRLDEELQIVGKFGLKNKREVWRAKYQVSQFRRAARILLTLEEKDPKRIFEGTALLRRLNRLGMLDDEHLQLDYILALKTEDIMNRRLQTLVHQLGLARSIHHARVLIRQRHIRVGKQVVDIPSFLVRVDSQKHIDLALNSPLILGGVRPGRVKRKSLANAAKKEGGADAGSEEASD